MKVVVPSNPYDAKGLLLSAIRDPNPVIFFEPKLYYRSLSDEIPEEDYMVPLGKASILQEGKDISVVGWGAQIQVLKKAVKSAEEKGISCELIDLRTLLPWDKEAVIKSVKKTGRLLVSHEAPKTCGLGAEIAQTIQEECFTYLEAPIKRVCGYDTPFPLIFETIYNPDEWKNLSAICDTVKYDFLH